MISIKQVSVFLLFSVSTIAASAQLSEMRHFNEGVLKVNYSHITTTCANHVWEPAQKYRYGAIGWEVERYDLEQGAIRWSTTSKLTEFAFQWIKHFYNQKSPLYLSDAPEVSSVLHYRFGYNVIASDRFVLSPGLGLDDYVFVRPNYDVNGDVVRREDGSGAENMSENSGWYWCTGPSTFFDVGLTPSFSIHGKAAYEVPFLQMSDKNVEPSIKKKRPHFVYFQVGLYHNSGLFAGIELMHGIDRGLNKTSVKRRELKVGYMFLL